MSKIDQYDPQSRTEPLSKPVGLTRRMNGVLWTQAILLVLAAFLARTVETHSARLSDALLSFEARQFDTEIEKLEEYPGQVLLVVNTAGRSGYTPQYEGRQAIHERYGAQGFAFLGFASNDLGAQQPGSDGEIVA